MVDWTSMLFMALYLFVLPVSYVSDKWGLRWSSIVSSGVCCMGAWIKTFSIHPDRFYVVFIGQSMVAITQVILEFFKKF